MFFDGPDGVKYRFYFRHERFDLGTVKLDSGTVPVTKNVLHKRANKDVEVPIRAATHCMVVKGPKESEASIAHGRALCSQLDQYNKELGRRIAILRAAEEVPTELREPLLNAYFTRKRGKSVAPSPNALRP